MGEGRDGLHLDCVSLLERVVEDSRRVNHLPSQVLVVCVAHVERFGSESVGLHIDVGASYLEKAKYTNYNKWKQLLII